MSFSDIVFELQENHQVLSETLYPRWRPQAHACHRPSRLASRGWLFICKCCDVNVVIWQYYKIVILIDIWIFGYFSQTAGITRLVHYVMIGHRTVFTQRCSSAHITCGQLDSVGGVFVESPSRQATGILQEISFVEINHWPDLSDCSEEEKKTSQRARKTYKSPCLHLSVNSSFQNSN